jgi:hypothetical protein
MLNIVVSRLTDERRTLTHDKSSPGLCPGELKKYISYIEDGAVGNNLKAATQETFQPNLV